jgi:hypothetical protein
MATSVHIPKPLLDAVDRRARSARMSRNRFIIRALEKEVERGTAWSPAFFDELAAVDPDDRAAVDDLVEAVRARRTRKAPPRL